jgi:hypothetical protein
MEETIVPTVLGFWVGSCGIWTWSQYRQARWEQLPLATQPTKGAKQARRALSGVLLFALNVIILYWPGLSVRSWLLPIEIMNHPHINQTGLLLIRLALFWVIVMTVQRDRWNRRWWKRYSLTFERWQNWEPYYAGQVAIAAAGLLLGLFITLSSGVTALLCVVGWWLCWRMWRAYVSATTKSGWDN